MKLIPDGFENVQPILTSQVLAGMDSGLQQLILGRKITKTLTAQPTPREVVVDLGSCFYNFVANYNRYRPSKYQALPKS